MPFAIKKNMEGDEEKDHWNGTTNQAINSAQRQLIACHFPCFAAYNSGINSTFASTTTALANFSIQTGVCGRQPTADDDDDDDDDNADGNVNGDGWWRGIHIPVGYHQADEGGRSGAYSGCRVRRCSSGWRGRPPHRAFRRAWAPEPGTLSAAASRTPSCTRSSQSTPPNRRPLRNTRWATAVSVA